MIFSSRLIVVLAFGALLPQGVLAANQGAEAMNSNQQSIQVMRSRHDAEIMSVEGVVSVGTGLSKDGEPCLAIGTSVPPEQVREKLPQAIFDVCVEITQVGEIKAQED